eukprot:gene3921-4175_t
MVIASALQQGSAASRHLARFHPQEELRSVQLYGVRPESLDWACRHLIQEAGVAHIDLNFGCPVRKVTAKGGGSALPLRPMLLKQLVAAAVTAATAAAGPGHQVPVTVKMRMGLTPGLQTFQQQYSPQAHWAAIKQLVDLLPPDLPVIGNGDIFEAADALQMVRETGCHGVMIGRGALGRPWLFSEAAAMLSGAWPAQAPPCLGEVLLLALHHLQGWADWEQDETSAVLKMRKLIPCYLGGFQSPCHLLQPALYKAKSIADWERAVSDPDQFAFSPSEPFPAGALRVARLKGSGQIRGLQAQKIALPHGWLDDPDGDVPEDLLSGMDTAACEG